METKPCECEHACHFPDEHKLSPNGNPGHRYGAKFAPRYLVAVTTPWGTFLVCKDCDKDCHGGG